MRSKRLWIVLGLAALVLSLLPWLGWTGYYFGVPGWDLSLPTLDLGLPSRWNVPGGETIYQVGVIPLHILGEVFPFVFFDGEGVVTVRPFWQFVFWYLVAGVCIRLATRAPCGDGAWHRAWRSVLLSVLVLPPAAGVAASLTKTLPAPPQLVLPVGWSAWLTIWLGAFVALHAFLGRSASPSPPAEPGPGAAPPCDLPAPAMPRP